MTLTAPHPLGSIAADGLGAGPATVGPQRVAVLGAGIAGLVAAYELTRAGHDVVLLEARNRVGGRIHTLREPFSDGLFAEAGAMRIPASHDLTHAYVEHFRLRTIPFTSNNPNGWYHLHGQRWRAAEVLANPALLPFELPEGERGKTPGQLWAGAIADLLARVEAGGEAAWAEIVTEFDNHSLEEFIVARGFSEAACEAYGLLESWESLMNSSFLEVLREEAGRCFDDVTVVAGGMDRLTDLFLPALRGRIRFGSVVTALSQDASSVTVHYCTPAGRFSVTGDYAVCTLPFGVLRHVEVLTPFARDKQRAIRQLRYDASTKILMQFRRRFWEEDDGIFGGATFTDLPIKAVFYPDQGGESGRGIVLASYTWAQDAERWASLAESDRITEALQNLAILHPQALAEFEVGTSWVWHNDPYAAGAFALFHPGQQTRLHDAIMRDEGRVLFAGEHVSLHHAWIQGAVESGLRAAVRIHTGTAGTSAP